VAVKHYRIYGDEVSKELAARYLAFLMYAHRVDGRFHNFIGFDRRTLDEVGSEDCFGRVLWALAWVIKAPPESGLTGPAERMLNKALYWISSLTHPRGKAFSITGLHRWAEACPAEADRVEELVRPLADDLVATYQQHSQPEWQWFLPEMTYDNAKLPEALFRAYQVTGSETYLDVAQRTMGFLSKKTYTGDAFCLVGNQGWYPSDGEKAPVYDQQPIDAAAMITASLAAFDATSQPEYLRNAWLALEWFFGRNVQGVSLYDPKTGGCFDGLTEHGVNKNLGAESTICLLLSQLSVLDARREISRRAIDLPAGNHFLDWNLQGVGGGE